MSFEARVHADVVFHERSSATFTVGAISDHIFSTPANATILFGVADTTPASIPGDGPLTTMAIKNTGAESIRVAGAFDVAPGRMAVLPTSETVIVETLTGTSTYTAIWIG